MGGVTDIGLTAQEFYYYGAGLEDLQADRRGFWTPNYSNQGFVQIPPMNPQGDFILEVSFYRRSTIGGIFIISNQPATNNQYDLNIYTTGNYESGQGRVEVFGNANSASEQNLGLGEVYSVKLSVTSGQSVLSVNGQETEFTYTRQPRSTRASIGSAAQGGLF